ncbi:FKBP-like protein [Terfezia boudieri ATCC MYA-4762]|uniref:Peptidyl-prolyl cis-trans isomerase n=1 Tax=Terfezia boudieri ATCC MYA-4762 TaxID=1051890 RepID=A0A3N4LKN5_9PEZI|nr:FKBP-like protein [Terfezia boudieri ATCC MYA-4762]
MHPKGKAAAKSKPKETSADDSSNSSSSKLKPATSISVRHILCAKHSLALTAISRLQAGESFDTVAREVSEDKARQGGNLGWKVRGSLIKEFEDAAYKLPVSSVNKPVYTTEPVKTSEGYHVIMVEGRK